MAETRLNRYVALAGYGTRRTAERLIAAGRIAVDGATVIDPTVGVAPGSSVTLDGRAIAPRDHVGVLVGLFEGELPAIAHPAELHLAARSDDAALLLSDGSLAARLARVGFEISRFAAEAPEPGAFRPLSAAELERCRVLSRILRSR